MIATQSDFSLVTFRRIGPRAFEANGHNPGDTDSRGALINIFGRLRDLRAKLPAAVRFSVQTVALALCPPRNPNFVPFPAPPDAAAGKCKLVSWVHPSTVSFYPVTHFYGTWEECEARRGAAMFPASLRTFTANEHPASSANLLPARSRAKRIR